MDGRRGACERLLEQHASLREGGAAQVTISEREQIERDERRWRGRGQLRDPRRRGMEPQLQQVEVETPGADDHELSIDDAALGQVRDERLPDLGEVPVQRTQVSALGIEAIAVLEDDGAEAVPFRFEEPAFALGQAVRELRQHRLDRRIDREPERAYRFARRRTSCPRHGIPSTGPRPRPRALRTPRRAPSCSAAAAKGRHTMIDPRARQRRPG
jgi:hypothetical protein